MPDAQESIAPLSRRLVTAALLSLGAGGIVGCGSKPEANPERQKLAIVARTPEELSGDAGPLNRSYIIAKLGQPLHDLAARDDHFGVDLACDGCAADLRIDLTVSARDYAAYQIRYELSAPRGRTSGSFARDEAYIRRFGASRPYALPGLFQLAVGKDLEAIGSRLVDLIEMADSPP